MEPGCPCAAASHFLGQPASPRRACRCDWLLITLFAYHSFRKDRTAAPAAEKARLQPTLHARVAIYKPKQWQIRGRSYNPQGKPTACCRKPAQPRQRYTKARAPHTLCRAQAYRPGLLRTI